LSTLRPPPSWNFYRGTKFGRAVSQMVRAPTASPSQARSLVGADFSFCRTDVAPTSSADKRNTMASVLVVGTGIAVAAFLVCSNPILHLPHVLGLTRSPGPSGPRRVAEVPGRRRRPRQGLLQGRLRAEDEQARGDADTVTEVRFFHRALRGGRGLNQASPGPPRCGAAR